MDTSDPHNNIYRLNNDYIDCMIHSKRNLVMQIARTIDSYNSLFGCFLSTKNPEHYFGADVVSIYELVNFKFSENS